MNMKRGLVFSLSALALVVGSSIAQAQNVQLSLNLRYTNPANPASGGTWYLVAKTDDTDGLAAINAYISNITDTAASMHYGNEGAVDTRYGSPGSVTNTTLAAIENGGNPYVTTLGAAVNILYGQDTATGPIVLDVGQGAGTPGNVATDPLLNTAWNNSAIIANGTFGGSRPAFVAAGANVTDSNTLANSSTTPPNNFAQDATTATPVVRGDSERTLGVEGANKGLWQGDADRNGVVNSSDLSLLLTNFNGTNETWGEGNFNNTAGSPNGVVNSSDLSLLLTNFNKTGIPVAASAVPEPNSLILVAGGALAALVARRRRA